MHPNKTVIGLISREYPPYTHVGGIGTYTAAAAKILADHNHVVHVFCNGPRAEKETLGGITVHRIPMGNHPLPQSQWFYPYRYWFRKYLPNYLDALTWAQTVGQYLEQQAATLQLEVLEFPETNGEGSRVSVRGILSQTLRICRIHTSWISHYVTGFLESKLLLRLQKKACHLSNRVVSPSQFMARYYAPQILGWKKDVLVNPNPLKLWEAPFTWQEKNSKHLLFVGRIEYRKGIDLLLGALAALGQEGKGLILRVIGAKHPPQNQADVDCQIVFETALKQHSREANPTGYLLEYLGQQSHDSLYQHYDWAGITVIPSRQDNYPYTALEALSRGCFVLASDTGGLPETLAACQGALFPQGDQDVLQQKMRELSQSEDEIRKAWDSNAHIIAERFSPEVCYQRLVSSYAKTNGNLETKELQPR